MPVKANPLFYKDVPLMTNIVGDERLYLIKDPENDGFWEYLPVDMLRIFYGNINLGSAAPPINPLTTTEFINRLTNLGAFKPYTRWSGVIYPSWTLQKSSPTGAVNIDLMNCPIEVFTGETVSNYKIILYGNRATNFKTYIYSSVISDWRALAEDLDVFNLEQSLTTKINTDIATINTKITPTNGNWTPTGSSAATVINSYSSCYWHKIFNRVFFSGEIELSTTTTTPAINGLPYQSLGAENANVSLNQLTWGGVIRAYALGTSLMIRLNNALTSQTSIYVNGSYRTN